MKQVYVVTMPELGWDCVVGVYDMDEVSYEELENIFPKDQYVLHEPREVETQINGFDD